ncbi:MAG TPA: DUF4843 domain-containing protein [Petrimonas sp.]|uniref:DUF4843 domain-containing protein n=1 Tax=Petrimonas sp. TaxID=2023866 RepID=UPI0017722BF2|nr:DUF4843 domain-containing protein [Petrimonas sp.]
MKRIFYMLFIVVMMITAACSEDQIKIFSGKPAIFMGVVMDRPNRPVESDIDTLRSISFGFTDLAEVTINFIARLQGNPVSHDRIVQVEPGGDAVIGTDYQLDNNVVLKAGEHYVLIPCRILRNPSMEDNRKEITLRIIGDEVFDAGDITTAYITVEDGIPGDWVNGWGAEYCFGPCTKDKYTFFYDFLGFYDLADTPQGDYASIANYLNSKIADYNMNPEKYNNKYGAPPLGFRFEYVYEP